MASFCRFWGMTPADVEAMDEPTYQAFVRYANKEIAARKREARKR